MVVEEVLENVREGVYTKLGYPVVVPVALRAIIDDREAVLREDAAAANAKLPDRDAVLAELKMYEAESLVKALVLKRPAAVVRQKKVEEGWNQAGVRVPWGT